MKKVGLVFLVLGIISLGLIVVGEVFAQSPIEKAVEQAISKGLIQKDAPKGYLGIPGAPSVNWILAFVWAMWVGWIFSTVGAFGGIMAGVGHMTIYGLGAYAKTFKDSLPSLNKHITDSIRVSNQFLVGLSALISSVTYIRQRRLVLPLGLAMGIGSLVATYIIGQTAGKVKFSQYQGYFGLCVFLVGAFMVYEMTPRGAQRKKAAKEAAKAFEQAVKQKVDLLKEGVKTIQFRIAHCRISFFGQEFTFNPVWAFIGGAVISAISSFIGVGGGFLYVPFLTSIVGLPMYVVAGTSALAVLISMILSIINFMARGVLVDPLLIGIQLVGIFVGSLIGPRTGKYIPDKILRWIFIILAVYVGLGYTLAGFFGIKVLLG
jgi:uncharacterized membrane protein YfcA